jgi:hypothetical protein
MEGWRYSAMDKWRGGEIEGCLHMGDGEQTDTPYDTDSLYEVCCAVWGLGPTYPDSPFLGATPPGKGIARQWKCCHGPSVRCVKNEGRARINARTCWREIHTHSRPVSTSPPPSTHCHHHHAGNYLGVSCCSWRLRNATITACTCRASTRRCWPL